MLKEPVKITYLDFADIFVGFCFKVLLTTLEPGVHCSYKRYSHFTFKVLTLCTVVLMEAMTWKLLVTAVIGWWQNGRFTHTDMVLKVGIYPGVFRQDANYFCISKLFRNSFNSHKTSGCLNFWSHIDMAHTLFPCIFIPSLSLFASLFHRKAVSQIERSVPVEPESHFRLIRVEVVASDANAMASTWVLSCFKTSFVVFSGWWNIVHLLVSIKRKGNTVLILNKKLLRWWMVYIILFSSVFFPIQYLLRAHHSQTLF